MRYILAILFSTLTLTACGLPVTYDPCSTSAGCSVPPAPAADDDDTTPEPAPALECDPTVLPATVAANQCPTGTYPSIATVTCIEGDWEAYLECVEFAPETEANDCASDLAEATATCLAGGGALDEFACSDTGHEFSCEYPDAPAGDCSEEIVASAAVCPEGSYLANFACDGETGSTVTQCIPFLPEETESAVDCEVIAVTAASMCDNEGQYLASFTCDTDGVSVICSEITDSDGDDDDTTSGDDDDDATPPAVDVLGNYGCTHPYDAPIIAWITTNGLPANLVRQDNDADGVYDEVWVSATLPWTELSLLDLNGNGQVDSSSWTCNSWADGTPDNVDNDGDGFTEAGGDLDDGTSGNRPGVTDACGDAVDNDYNGSLDEECVNDVDGDGYTELGDDCNDAASTINPVAAEYNNSVDDDCDGTVDEASSVDTDGDGYCEDGIDNDSDGDCRDVGEPSSTTYDCAEANAATYPGAPDWGGDGNDNDCDGTDE